MLILQSCRNRAKPLQISVGVGMPCASLAPIGVLYALFLRLFTDMWVEGWMALMIAVLWIGGVELISVGLLGEYIGCIYQEMKSRPPYEVRNTSGFASEGPAMSRSSVLNNR